MNLTVELGAFTIKAFLVFIGIFLVLAFISAPLAYAFASFIGHSLKVLVTGLAAGFTG